jgi:cellulose synthase/poly-beta-1,6-N-acetylglucosamine synthase-like glycosyltransferase
MVLDMLALLFGLISATIIFANTSLMTLSLLSRSTPLEPPVIDLSKHPEVTIVIPAYREGPNIRYVLQSIKDVNYPKDRLEIVVVGEEDDFETYSEILKICEVSGNELACGGVRGRYLVNRSGTRNKPAALNFALRYVRSEIVAFFDAEDTVHRDHIAIAVNFLLEDNSTAAVQFVREVAPEFGDVGEVQRTDFWLYYRVILPYIMHKTRLPEICGSAFFTRLSYLNKVGGFNLGSPAEDLDLTYRFGARGWKIVVAEPPSVTRPITRTSSLVKQRARWIRGGILAIPQGVRALPRSAPLLLVTGLMPISSVTSTLALIFSLASILLGGGQQAIIVILVLVSASSIGALPLALLAGNKERIFKYLGLMSAIYFLASWRAVIELFVAPHSWNKSEDKG